MTTVGRWGLVSFMREPRAEILMDEWHGVEQATVDDHVGKGQMRTRFISTTCSQKWALYYAAKQVALGFGFFGFQGERVEGF